MKKEKLQRGRICQYTLIRIPCNQGLGKAAQDTWGAETLHDIRRAGCAILYNTVQVLVKILNIGRGRKGIGASGARYNRVIMSLATIWPDVVSLATIWPTNCSPCMSRVLRSSRRPRTGEKRIHTFINFIPLVFEKVRGRQIDAADGDLSCERFAERPRCSTLLSLHIRGEIRHGIRGSCETIPMAVPRVDPQSRLQNGLSRAAVITKGPVVGGRDKSSSYKRVKGRSHTVEKRISMLPHKPHATSQPSRFSHTPRLSTDSAHNLSEYLHFGTA